MSVFDFWRGKPKRRAQRRRLRVERLERRELMAYDLATIAGTVFNDLTGNGLTGDDTRQSGVTVQLYLDGGNLTFDNGGGDDVLVATDTTDAQGLYDFEQLASGDYFVNQVTPTGVIPATTPVAVTVFAADADGQLVRLIDGFDTTAQTVIANPVNQDSTGTIAATEVLNGERDIRVRHTAGAGNVQVSIDEFNSNQLTFASGAGVVGSATVQYDGADGDATALDDNGLGGVDLTNGSTRAGLRVSSQGDDTAATAVIRAYTTATNFSTVAVPLSNTPLDDYFVPFTSFTVGGGTGADFSDIGAIELVINGVSNSDVILGIFSSIEPTVLTTNFANQPSLSLGNLIWSDDNNNGTVDTGEAGLANVDVNLYRDTNNNGSFNNGVDTLVGTTTTDANGNYLFSSLSPGNYLVQIPQAEFNTGSTLDSYTPSAGTPADPDNDVNGDNNGATVTGFGVATAAVTLSGNAEPTNDGDTDANTNLSVDIGLRPPRIELSVVKTANVTNAVAGGTINYTVSVTNDGPSDASNVIVTDTLPTSLTVNPANVTGGTAALAGQTLTVTIPAIAAGATVDVVVPATIASSATGTLNNVVVVSGGGFVETGTRANNTNLATPLIQNIDLGITKTATPTTAIPGQNLTYSFTVTNGGVSDAANVAITDTLPAGVTLVAGSGTGATVTEAGGTVTATIGTLAAGANTNVTFQVLVAATVTTALTNTASVAGTGTESPNTLANTANITTPVEPHYELTIDKSDNGVTGVPGATLVYTVTVNNAGPSNASGVTVTDTLPATLSNIQTTVGTVAGQTITATLPTITAGGSQSFQITATIDPAATGTINNTAQITTATGIATSGDNLTNNSDTEPTPLAPQFDLAITKSSNAVAGQVSPGQVVTFTITARNAGPSVAAGVSIVDAFPTTLQNVQAQVTAGTATVNLAGNTLTANLGTVNPNDPTVTIQVTGTVAAAATGTINSTATVSSTTAGEVNVLANTADAPVIVVPADSTIRGSVVIDNGNTPNVRDVDDEPLPGVTITLTGIDLNGNAIAARTTTTNVAGDYEFANLVPGIYTVIQTQPVVFDVVDSRLQNGSGQATINTTVANQFSTILIPNAGAALLEELNFLERRTFSKRRFIAQPLP